jgi:hypothetical protein
MLLYIIVCQHVLADAGETNTRDCIYEYAVTLEDTTYASVCLEDTAASDTVCMYNFVLICY